MNPERLSARRVAELLRSEPAPVTANAEEAATDDRDLLAAAVLLPLLDGIEAAELLFIHRTRDNTDFSGQVSFPGGMHKPGDADLFATALRESREEVGVDPERVERVCALAPVATLNKFRIHPFLSLWPAEEYTPASPREVEHVFRVPLSRLLDPASTGEAEVTVRGRRLRVPAFLHEDEVIWGATRRITLDLLDRLRRALD